MPVTGSKWPRNFNLMASGNSGAAHVPPCPGSMSVAKLSPNGVRQSRGGSHWLSESNHRSVISVAKVMFADPWAQGRSMEASRLTGRKTGNGEVSLIQGEPKVEAVSLYFLRYLQNH